MGGEGHAAWRGRRVGSLASRFGSAGPPGPHIARTTARGDRRRPVFPGAGRALRLAAGSTGPAEAFGAPAFGRVLRPDGVPGAGALGAPSLAVALAGAGGLATTETFGAADVVSVRVLFDAGGVATGEALGVPDLDLGEETVRRGYLILGPARRRLWLREAGGIPSGEGFGVAEVEPSDPDEEEAVALVLAAVLGGLA